MKPFDLTNPDIVKFCNDITSPFKQRLWMMSKLPSALFMGVRVRECSPEGTRVTVPYGWRSQNPFKSIYFAAQAAAAEMSTGLLAMMALAGRGNISVLVADLKGEFVKKAVSKTSFTCVESQKIFDAVRKAIETGEGQTVTVESIGTQENGEVVSRFYFTWTFKVRK